MVFELQLLHGAPYPQPVSANDSIRLNAYFYNKVNEYKGIEKADLNMEKVLADVFDTNLGSIDIVDSGKHIFKVNDWKGKDINVIIY